MSDLLSARAAAQVCDVDERTVRRWVKSGQLAADKRGGRFLIARSALEPFTITTTDTSNGHERTDAANRTGAAPDAVSLNLELVRLVDRLQQENRDLASLVGQFQERVRVLEALPAPQLTESALTGPPRNGTIEPSDGPAEPKRRPWWRVW